jgi:hypothetical protein
MSSTFIHLPPITTTGPIEVSVDASNDSIKISDGVDTLAVNADGSINANITGSISGEVTAILTGVNEYEYAETTIASGATVTVVSRFFPDDYKLRRVRGSGENIAVYYLKFTGVGVDKLRSTYTDFNATFDYETGIAIPGGTTVAVDVTNSSTTPGLFSVQLLFSAV